MQFPAEILLELLDFLAKLSAVALTLSCRLWRWKFGDQNVKRINEFDLEPETGWSGSASQLKDLTTEQIDRDLLLELFATGSLDFIYCHYYRKLHSPERTGSDLYSFPTDKQRPHIKTAIIQHTSTYLHQDFISQESTC
jgi:hypothetical protein